jgi:hypothetical protein
MELKNMNEMKLYTGEVGVAYLEIHDVPII